ncbi:MAG: VCBS repeat-containing protein [Bdellovibrionales bacterium]|nr:VCBS repeat-containing protein [Bdellovibrionales bacterium]
MNYDKLKGFVASKGRVIFCLFFSLGVLSWNSNAIAQAISNVDDVNGLGSGFREVENGTTWLDVSNFFGADFSSIESSLVGSGFRIANKADLERLFAAQMVADEIIGEKIVCGPGLPRPTCNRGFFDDSASGSSTLLGNALLQDPASARADDDQLAVDFSGAGFGAWVVQHTAASCDSSPTSLDFDCDSKDEKVVWRSTSGTWFIKMSSGTGVMVQQWGLPGDHPVAGDYDGDGIPDLAVWRPSTGTWFIKTSSTVYSVASSITLQFGLPGDRPLRNDFDGDGRLDVGVWRPTDGNFYYVRSSDAQIVVEQFGLNGDVPLVSVATE